MIKKTAVCLAVGGSDSCGGAGIQADLATFNKVGVKGCSAITALTAQNPNKVLRIEPSPPDQFAAELESIFTYYEVTAIKSGMLVDSIYISLLKDSIQENNCLCPLVIDPVMVSTSGTKLLNDSAFSVLVEELFPLATLITPNFPEASKFLGRSIDDQVEAAAELVHQFKRPILLKGGHAKGDAMLDVLGTCDGNVHLFGHPRENWDQDQAHGSGCRLAAAVTAFMALASSVEEAVSQGINILTHSK